MPDSRPQLPKKAADFVAKLTLVAEDGDNSFRFIMVHDGDLIVFHKEISGYTISRTELDYLADHDLVKVASYPAGPYPSGIADDDDDRAFTGYFSLTQHGLRVGRLLSQPLRQGATNPLALAPVRQQAGPSQQSSSNTSQAETGATGLPTPDELIASAAKFLIEGGGG